MATCPQELTCAPLQGMGRLGFPISQTGMMAFGHFEWPREWRKQHSGGTGQRCGTRGHSFPRWTPRPSPRGDPSGHATWASLGLAREKQSLTARRTWGPWRGRRPGLALAYATAQAAHLPGVPLERREDEGSRAAVQGPRGEGRLGAPGRHQPGVVADALQPEQDAEHVHEVPALQCLLGPAQGHRASVRPPAALPSTALSQARLTGHPTAQAPTPHQAAEALGPTRCPHKAGRAQQRL